jgi:hypothetical protein
MASAFLREESMKEYDAEEVEDLGVEGPVMNLGPWLEQA